MGRERARERSSSADSRLNIANITPTVFSSSHQPRKQKNNDLQLPLPRSGRDEDTGLFSFANWRASSPLQGDISIDQQLADFQEWLRTDLSPNRLARLEDVFQIWGNDERLVDDIRKMGREEARQDKIPLGLFTEIQKRVPAFKRWYKQGIQQQAGEREIQLNEEEQDQARVLLQLGRESGRIQAEELQSSQFEDDYRYSEQGGRDSSQLSYNEEDEGY